VPTEALWGLWKTVCFCGAFIQWCLRLYLCLPPMVTCCCCDFQYYYYKLTHSWKNSEWCSYYCRVVVNGTSLVCITTSVANATTLPVSVFFDDVQRQLDAVFEFVENPTVTNISPLSSFAAWVLYVYVIIYYFTFDHINHFIHCTFNYCVSSMSLNALRSGEQLR